MQVRFLRTYFRSILLRFELFKTFSKGPFLELEINIATRKYAYAKFLYIIVTNVIEIQNQSKISLILLNISKLFRM